MIMLAELMYVGFAMLTLKALWNISVSYISYRRLVKNPLGTDSSVSFEIGIDLIILCWTILFVVLTDEAYLFCSKGSMLLLCLLLPIGSFVGAFAFGVVFGFVVAKILTR